MPSFCLRLIRTITALPVGLIATPVFAAGCPVGFITLLEPVNGARCVPTTGGGLNTFFLYFNALWPWLVGSATGAALLWVLIATIQYIASGGDQSKQTEAKTKMTHAIIGLLMIIFSAVLLNILNPNFFVF